MLALALGLTIALIVLFMLVMSPVYLMRRF